MTVRALWVTVIGPTSANLPASPSWLCNSFLRSKHRALLQGRKKGNWEESSCSCSCPLVPGKHCFPRNLPSPAKRCL